MNRRYCTQRYETPLMMAIEHENVEIVTLLLSKNANVNASNEVTVVQEGRSRFYGLLSCIYD